MAEAVSDVTTDTDTNTQPQWRLRYRVGDLEHYTEWTTEFPTVENRYEQFRRGDHTHDTVIERRAVVRR